MPVSDTFSATSPQALAPATPVNATMSPSLQTPPLFTKKEWVVPPRPKPGRKPAADAPPTKRKAQNRAAQRAFRERRAARVGDLEEQMKEMEEREGKEREELQDRLRELETSVENYNRLLLSWQERYHELQLRFENERKLRENAEMAVIQWRERRGSSMDVAPLPPRHHHLMQDGGQSHAAENLNIINGELPIGCGGCSQNSRCECIEQVLEMGNLTTHPSTNEMNRPLSPVSPIDAQIPTHFPTSDHNNLEIDFTAKFSTQRPTPVATSTSTSSALQPMPDPCGFCQDGTPCICAEMAAEASNSSNSSKRFSEPSGTRPPTRLAMVTESPCAKGPGTCAQCLSSPNSTLFCKSLAATRANRTLHTQSRSSPRQKNDEARNSPVGGGTTASTPGATVVGRTGPMLSCADTFTTLSRHPAFERANEELGSWMPQLATGTMTTPLSAFEVEAASVMGVLKFFDRRFGNEKK
jgi:hypothetical protein